MDEEHSGDGPHPWPREGSEAGPDLRLFRVRWDRLTNPRNGRRLRGLVLETPDWCNVVARTPEGHVVVVRQFRFGQGRVTTEIPGGMVERGEDPLDAARRELREETGFEAPSWTSLGSVAPNPAFLDNRCHLFLAEGARLAGELQLDSGEDIVVDTLDEARLRAAIRSGEIDHGLALNALAAVFDLRGDRPAVEG